MIRSPSAALAQAAREYASARVRDSGSMKPTDAPPSTQSMSKSLNPWMSRALAPSRRRIRMASETNVAVRDGVGHDARGRAYPELAHEIGAVSFDRLVAHAEQLRHLTGAVALRDQGDDFLLTLGEHSCRVRMARSVGRGRPIAARGQLEHGLTDVVLAAGEGVNGVEELAAMVIAQQVAISACAACGLDGLAVAARGQDQHARLGPAAFDVRDGLGAGFHRQREVHDHDIRAQIPTRADRFPGAAEGAVDVQILGALQQGAQSVADDALLVDHHDMGLATHLLLAPSQIYAPAAPFCTIAAQPMPGWRNW